ncbi:unnamed protein product [Macrosiphum euphorbiae]|uniref:DUF4806 domain-containing protein n=1 Tax=Macrosiphum euphorbiae TaxID=13131 RepID=A0AAV0XYR0_9HEMI|nr:unnamed protein product [Macrosiphum euphorbiae]
MTYHIVIFVQEDTVEVVPSHWLSKDGTTCAWPRRNLDPKKQIEKKTNPNTSDFNWYDVRILAKDIATLKDAKTKCSKATHTSDLSEIENKETRKLRCKILGDADNYDFNLKKKKKNLSACQKPPKTFSPPKLIDDTDNSDFDDSDTDRTFSLPNMNSCVKKSPVKYFEVKMSEKQQNMSKNNNYRSPSRKLSLEGPSSNIIKINSPASSGKWKVIIDNNNSRSTKSSKRKLNFDSMSQKTNGNRNSKGRVSQSPKHFESINTDLLKSPTRNYRLNDHNIDDVVTTQVDFNTSPMPCSRYTNDVLATDGLRNTLINLTRSITNIKYDMKNYMIKIDRIENMLSDIHANQNKSFSKEVNHLVNDSIYKFPMTNIDELNIFEEKLGDIEFRQKVVHYLSRLERDSVSDMTRQIMSKMFHNNLLSQFSYAGQKHKMVFATLHSCSIIFETVRSVQKHRNCTDQEVLKPMKFFMANAKFREEKKQQKIHSL